ncbi:MAG: hypothetical protein ABII79_10495 [bacterium]
MKKILIILAILGLGATVLAQSSERAQLETLTRANSLGVKPVASPFSLLDFSRMQWSHRYSVSYFSGGYGSGSLGMLNSMMLYELSSSFTLGVNLNVAHGISGAWRDSNSDISVFPGVWLDYHPSDKVHMSVGVQRYPGSVNQLWNSGYMRPLCPF